MTVLLCLVIELIMYFWLIFWAIHLFEVNDISKQTSTHNNLHLNVTSCEYAKKISSSFCSLSALQDQRKFMTYKQKILNLFIIFRSLSSLRQPTFLTIINVVEVHQHIQQRDYLEPYQDYHTIDFKRITSIY